MIIDRSEEIKVRMRWLMCAATLAASSIPAHATLYDFELVAEGAASLQLQFTLPANPTPDFVATNRSYFELDDISYIQGGAGDCFPCQGSFYFYTTTHGQKGGVQTPNGYYEGPQLFSGTAASPAFVIGDYNIKYIDRDSFYNGAPGSIYIMESAANTVPEPATWAMIVVGTGLVGLTLRRRVAVAFSCV